jgi:hypothetical protein
MLRPHYPRWKSPQYPLDRRLGGPYNRSRRRGEEKNLALKPGLDLRPLGRPGCSQSPYRLRYPNSKYTWWREKIMKLLIVKFSSTSCCLVTVICKYVHQHRVLKLPQCTFCPWGENWMLLFNCQDVISLVLSSHQKKSKCPFANRKIFIDF